MAVVTQRVKIQNSGQWVWRSADGVIQFFGDSENDTPKYGTLVCWVLWPKGDLWPCSSYPLPLLLLFPSQSTGRGVLNLPFLPAGSILREINSHKGIWSCCHATARGTVSQTLVCLWAHSSSPKTLISPLKAPTAPTLLSLMKYM